ncbi:MAG: hypothetical protein ACETWT_16695 [Thermodesulfobacteriota bacterium]
MTLRYISTEHLGEFEVMSITKQPIICIWNILRYGFGIMSNNTKERDIEKIARYAELRWTLSEGKTIKKARSDSDFPKRERDF